MDLNFQFFDKYPVIKLLDHKYIYNIVLHRVPWLMPVIIATQEMELGRIVVQSQPEQKVWEATSQPIAGHRGLSSQQCRMH
jgi:hypothetical protein